MLFFKPSHIVPKHLRKVHLVLRILLGVIFFIAGFTLFIHYAFPSEVLSYEHRAKAGENTLSRPTTSSGTPIKNGLLPAGDSLLVYAGTGREAERVDISITLEDDPKRPETLTLSIRKSYRAFFLPDGDPIVSPPKDRIFTVDRKPYLWNGKEGLVSFISEAAALSRFTSDKISQASDDILRIFPPQGTTTGFRIGTLLADDRSVYIVSGDREIRPFGSDDIFEALGYKWGRIITASEDELAFYKQGPLLRFDTIQPDGTLFHDTKTDFLYEIRDNTRHVIEDKSYRNFLVSRTDPIEANAEALETTLSCTLRNSFLSRQTYSCAIPLGNLKKFPGRSYELSIDAPSDIRIRSIRARFDTKISTRNLFPLLRDFRERIAERYKN